MCRQKVVKALKVIDEAESLARSVTTVTGSPTCIVDVVALDAPPVVRTWDVGTTTHVLTGLFLLLLRLLLVAFLATVPEIKIHKVTLGTIPLSAFPTTLLPIP